MTVLLAAAVDVRLIVERPVHTIHRLAVAHTRERHVPVIVPRVFNGLSPRQTGRYGMVLASGAAQAVRGDAIRVFGTGEQSRCASHVRDVVRALLRLVDAAAVGQVVNIGTDREVTIRRLASRAIARPRRRRRSWPTSFAYPYGVTSSAAAGGARAHAACAVTAEPRMLRAGDDVARLPRLDGCCLRHPAQFEHWASRASDARLRAAVRRARPRVACASVGLMVTACPRGP